MSRGASCLGSIPPVRSAGIMRAAMTAAAALQRSRAGQKGCGGCGTAAAYLTASSRSRRGASR